MLVILCLNLCQQLEGDIYFLIETTCLLDSDGWMHSFKPVVTASLFTLIKNLVQSTVNNL